MGGMGGGALNTMPQAELPELIVPSSKTAQIAQESLDELVELGELKTELGKLGDSLTEILSLPVFVDERAIEMAELSADTMIDATLPKLPLRSALRRLLHPHGLRVVVEEEGLVITADFTELTRRGIATDHWVESSDVDAQIHAGLKKTVTVDFVDTPLKDAIATLSELADTPMIIDTRALEEIGLTDDQPCGLRISNVRMRSLLRLLLREMDLTYLIKDEVLQITTVEAAEQNLVNRVYFLEGTGFPIGDFDSVIGVIQTAIVPDTWEQLGGPSSIAPATGGAGARPAILVSTTSDVHEAISSLLSSLRRTHVGPDPRTRKPTAPARPEPQPAPVVGGMF
jgi:hypothetical protein